MICHMCVNALYEATGKKFRYDHVGYRAFQRSLRPYFKQLLEDSDSPLPTPLKDCKPCGPAPPM